jgi:hypothetical protein
MPTPTLGRFPMASLSLGLVGGLRGGTLRCGHLGGVDDMLGSGKVLPSQWDSTDGSRERLTVVAAGDDLRANPIILADHRDRYGNAEGSAGSAEGDDRSDECESVQHGTLSGAPHR